MDSAEDKARKILFEIGVDNPDKFSSGDLLPLSNLINKSTKKNDSFIEAIEAINQLAHAVSNYYLECKRTGFSDENAIKLTESFQRSLININKD